LGLVLFFQWYIQCTVFIRLRRDDREPKQVETGWAIVNFGHINRYLITEVLSQKNWTTFFYGKTM
jgi:hypothetical protein